MTKPNFLPLGLCLLLAGCEAAPVAAPSSAPASPPPASTAAPKTTASSPAPAASVSAKPSGGASAPASAKPAASGAASPSGLTSVEEQTVRAVQQVGPGVVKITHSLQGGQALGSGTIIDAKGYILTNAHVAEGSTTYQVTLANNQAVQGKLVGLDPFDDLAVIQINQPDLPVVEMGDSSKLQVGQTVLAIGNPIGFTRTVTSGIVRALH